MADVKELKDEELEKVSGGTQCGDQEITGCTSVCEEVCKNCKYLDGVYTDTYGAFDYECKLGKGKFTSNNKYFEGGIETCVRKVESEVVQDPR